VVQVVEEDAHDLAETQRDDGQVVAAQAQRGQAEDDPGQRGKRGPRRQGQPERQVNVEVRRSEEGEGVGAHRVEGDVAQVEQTGEAHHQVEADGEHHVEHRKIENAHPGLAEQHGNQRRGEGQGNHHPAGRRRVALAEPRNGESELVHESVLKPGPPPARPTGR
jgi:hypothetical protein